MNLDRAFDVAALIVVAGIITTLVAHRNTAGDINALGSAFTNSILAATGQNMITNAQGRRGGY